MSAVVQARCPGCKNVLRIPASWVSQPIRCKHCGVVMHSQGVKATAPRGSTPPPTSRIPATKPAPPAVPGTPPRAQAAPLVSPAPQAVPVSTPRNAAPGAAPAAQVVPAVTATPAPAIPVAPVALPAPAASTAWDGLDEYAARTPGSARRRRSSWKGIAVLLTLLAISGTLTYFSWSHVSSLLSSSSPQNEEVASTGTTSTRSTSTPSTPVGAGPGTSTPGPGTPLPGTSTPSPATPSTPSAGRQPRETRTPPPPAGSIVFPRRALVISIHNYLYANPIDPGLPVTGAFNMTGMLPALTRGLYIPMNQIAHLSDAAQEKDARPPLKGMIEETISSFLNTSRDQDRIMVFFIGHSAVIDDEPYLVPIEGELDNAATLIPLKWVYEQLKSCKAAQKILVLDVNRFNPVYGLERPNSGPMEEKFAQAVMNPPQGIQVWAACSQDQLSYATDDSPMGVFLEEMWQTMSPPASRLNTGKTLRDGKIQRPNEPIPIERLHELVNEWMQKRLESEKLAQVAILGGSMMDNGAAYNAAEPLAPPPTLARVPEQNGGLAASQLIRSVLDEIGAPPVKQTLVDNSLNYSLLPPFTAKLDEYLAPTEDSKVKQEIRKARAVLWAVSSSEEVPADLAKEVQTIRDDLQVTLNVLKDGYRIPSAQAEARFKEMVFDDERQVAIILSTLSEALEQLESVKDDKEMEPKRWQANYDFVLARLQAQVAYLYEYQSMLGLMRKELPPNDPAKHSRWLLASTTSLQGDSNGRKLARYAARTYDTLATDHAGTPWEVLAKREKLTALGLEWKAAR